MTKLHFLRVKLWGAILSWLLCVMSVMTFGIFFFCKQVDIFQVCVIEMKDREGSPLFHLEHFIEGKYIKYNSNSGYVLRDETLRCSPQV